METSTNQTNIPPSNSPEQKPHVKLFLILSILIVGAVVGILVWQFIGTPKPENKLPISPPNLNQLNPSNMNTDLKTHLEEAYNKARAVLESKGSMASFLEVFEVNNDPSVPQITEDQWSYMLKTLSGLYPDLQYTKFLKIEERGNYAYYIVEIHRPDSKGLNITALAFRKNPAGWQLSGKNTVSQGDSTVSTAEEIETVRPKLMADLEKDISEQDNN